MTYYSVYLPNVIVLPKTIVLYFMYTRNIKIKIDETKKPIVQFFTEDN
jgi:hypothetical protein